MCSPVWPILVVSTISLHSLLCLIHANNLTVCSRKWEAIHWVTCCQLKHNHPCCNYQIGGSYLFVYYYPGGETFWTGSVLQITLFVLHYRHVIVNINDIFQDVCFKFVSISKTIGFNIKSKNITCLKYNSFHIFSVFMTRLFIKRLVRSSSNVEWKNNWCLNKFWRCLVDIKSGLRFWLYFLFYFKESMALMYVL